MSSMDRDSELALVGRLRAGDPDAFDGVHDCFNARLFNFLARLSRRREVAEDLVEETWLRLVAGAAHLQPDTRLGPWPSGSPPPSPFDVAVASEAGRRIDAALGALPVAYREALLLVVVEGLRP